MQKKLLPLLGIAFVVAIVATGILYGLIAGKLNNSSGPRAARSIVVAARDLQPTTVLKVTDVKLAPWGAELPKGAFTTTEQVAGMTVLEMIRTTEPVTQPRLAPKDSAGAALAVPAGMRAVSVRAVDSAGVVGMLRAGHRVDVQVFRTRQGGEVELRTLLQNIEVLNVAPAEGSQSRNAASVVTVLAKPAEAELLGLADSGARVRLALRHPTDGEKTTPASLGLANVFDRAGSRAGPLMQRAETGPRSAARAHAASAVYAAGADRRILLQVRIAGAAQGALDELSSRLLSPRRADLLQVSAFRPGWDLENALRGFQSSRQIDVLSASHLTAGNNRQVSMHAGALWNGTRTARGAGELPLAYGIRIQFVPSMVDGRLRLRVQPEIASPQGEGVATRKIETEVELADGQSLLVSGLAEARQGELLWERLFPGQTMSSANRELVVLVTQQWTRATTHRQTAGLLERR